MSQLAGLSLAAGVVVAETLHSVGLEGHALKWPNDVLFDGRKLAGILVDVSGEAGGPATAVIGVGINLRIPAADAGAIDQPWTDLAQVGVAPSRNRVAGLLIDRMVDACMAFSSGRLEDFLARWERFDRLRGRPVAIVRGGHVVEGIYRGIAPSGALVLEDAGGRTEHHAGEVSLRMPDAI
jgi:BirA family biotin operon repressor/biotin-[acetyl-CoA-carboxylase] ligase